MQDSAEESLSIEIIKASCDTTAGTSLKRPCISVELTARVQQVAWTHAGIGVDDTITVTYVHYVNAWTDPETGDSLFVDGSESPDILIPGDTSRAFLNKSDTSYGAAAHSYTFKPYHETTGVEVPAKKISGPASLIQPGGNGLFLIDLQNCAQKASVQLFTPAGRCISAHHLSAQDIHSMAVPAGITVVRLTMEDGTVQTARIGSLR
ncbi:MAG: hypothetical protein ACQEQV_10615 [Fibrobacterota bacterium]